MESTRQYKILLVAAVLVAGFIAALAAGSASAQVSAAVTPEADAAAGERTLSVSGAATAKAQPNKVQVVFAVDTVKETARAALDENAGTTNAVLDALEAAGVRGNETSTADFAINPVYEYSPVGKRAEPDWILREQLDTRGKL